jgi:hypothetical protein
MDIYIPISRLPQLELRKAILAATAQGMIGVLVLVMRY